MHACKCTHTHQSTYMFTNDRAHVASQWCSCLEVGVQVTTTHQLHHQEGSIRVQHHTIRLHNVVAPQFSSVGMKQIPTSTVQYSAVHYMENILTHNIKLKTLSIYYNINKWYSIRSIFFTHNIKLASNKISSRDCVSGTLTATGIWQPPYLRCPRITRPKLPLPSGQPSSSVRSACSKTLSQGMPYSSGRHSDARAG